MDSTDLRDFAARYTAAWCSGNAASVAAFFGERGSLQINDGAPAVGRAAIAAAAQEFMTAFPDLVVRMDDASLDRGRAVYRWTLTGANTGPGGNGRAVRISGYEEWRIGADGLIAESKGHFDEREYRRQLESGGAMPDTWSDGPAYESYVGRWSLRIAREFLGWLAVPAGSAWLDFGCGTGALSRAILADASPRLVIGCDRSAGYVAFAKRQTPDDRAAFVVAELPELPRTPGGFDAVVAGLVLNFLEVPADAVAAMQSRARKGGTVAAYVWDYAEGMELMRIFWNAAAALDPGARALDEGARFPLCRPEPLQELFRAVGLREVRVQSIEVPTVFRSFDDYWTPFLSGQGPAPGYATSLTSQRQVELREAVRRRLPVSPDGVISLRARAWAVKGLAAS